MAVIGSPCDRETKSSGIAPVGINGRNLIGIAVAQGNTAAIGGDTIESRIFPVTEVGGVFNFQASDVAIRIGECGLKGDEA